MKNSVILVFLLLLIPEYSVNLQNINDMKEDNETRIYPNPLAPGQDLHVESNEAIFSVEVLDIIGKTIQQKNSENFDTKSLSLFLDNCKQGVYIVKIKFQSNTYAIKKLLVKNQ